MWEEGVNPNFIATALLHQKLAQANSIIPPHNEVNHLLKWVRQQNPVFDGIETANKLVKINELCDKTVSYKPSSIAMNLPEDAELLANKLNAY